MSEKDRLRFAVRFNTAEAKPLYAAAQEMLAVAAKYGLSVVAGQFAAELACDMMLKSPVASDAPHDAPIIDRLPYAHTRMEHEPCKDPNYRPLCVHCPQNYNPYTTPEVIRKWKGQTGWRRFMHTFKDTENATEAFGILEKHKLTQREVAVLVTTFHLGPGFTLDDFGPNDGD